MGATRMLSVVCDCGCGEPVQQGLLWLETNGKTFLVEHIYQMSAMDWILTATEGGDQMWVRKSLTDGRDDAVEFKHMGYTKYRDLPGAHFEYDHRLNERKAGRE